MTYSTLLELTAYIFTFLITFTSIHIFQCLILNEKYFQGGDWERKNRLRSYEGLYKMAVRDFKGASALFLEAVPTFGSYELISYEQLVFYTVVSCMLGTYI